MTIHARVRVVMSRIQELTMHLLIAIAIVIGFTFFVVLGLLSVIADLLALTRHRPPSFFDEFPEDDEESTDRNGLSTSSYAVNSQATVAADINAANWPHLTQTGK
jgi:hypothetical protein